LQSGMYPGKTMGHEGDENAEARLTQGGGGGGHPGNTMGPRMQISPLGTSARASYFISGMDSRRYSMEVDGRPMVPK